jgi:hypothetical protein
MMNLVRERLNVNNGVCRGCGKVLDVSSLGGSTGKTINASANRKRELVSSRLGEYSERVDLNTKKMIKNAKAPVYDKQGSICRCLNNSNFEHAKSFLKSFYNLKEISLGGGDNTHQVGELIKVKVVNNCLKLYKVTPQITNTDTVMVLEKLLKERRDITAIDFKGVFIFRDEYDAMVDLIVDCDIEPINMPEYLVRYLSASLYTSTEQTPASPRPVGVEDAVMYNTRELRETAVSIEVCEGTSDVVSVYDKVTKELKFKVANAFNGDVLILDSRSAILI